MNGQFPLGSVNPFKYFFGLASFFAILFTLMLDHNNQSPVSVLIQWLLQTNGIVAVFIGSHILLSSVKLSLVAWQKLFISGVLASIVFTPISLLIDMNFGHNSEFNLSALTDEWLSMAPPAIACWALVNLPWLLGIKFNYSTKQTPSNTDIPVSQSPLQVEQKAESSNATDATFVSGQALQPVDDDFTKLVDKIGAQNVVMLKSELHYLSVVGTESEQLILYSLKDAISLLENQYHLLSGSQVHRSYWVNKPFVISIEKKAREGRLLLLNNHIALVSRANMAKVKTWF